MPWKAARFHILHASANLFHGRRDLLERAGPVRDVKTIDPTDASCIGQLRASDLTLFAQSMRHFRDLTASRRVRHADC